MSNPRIIATTASAALIAAVGAGAAVYAVEIATSANDPAAVSGTEADRSPSLQSGQDDSTTVYRSPSDDDDDDHADDSGQLAPAPPSTQWNQNNTAPKNNSNTSKSS